jgi:alcohol dehydrogenase
MQISLLTSLWFTVAEGEELARMAAAGTLNLHHLEAKHFSLDEANEAIAAASDRAGGFTSIIVKPNA